MAIEARWDGEVRYCVDTVMHLAWVHMLTWTKRGVPYDVLLRFATARQPAMLILLGS
jgi:hypothetical protein